MSVSQFIAANTLNEIHSKIKMVKLSLPMTKIHTVGVKAQLHSLLALVLHGVECQTHALAALSPGVRASGTH
jgi:hypothetical protein